MLSRLLILILTFPLFFTSVVSQTSNKDDYVVEAIVLKIGPKSKYSGGGRRPAIQLAKYKIEKVSRGTIEEKEIIVDHLSAGFIVPLNGIQVGDRVCIKGYSFDYHRLKGVYAQGIREPNEEVKRQFFTESKVEKLEKVEACADNTQ